MPQSVPGATTSERIREIPYNYTSFSDREIVIRLLGASAWATKNLSSPFYLEKDQMITIGPDDEDPLAIEFQFPYFTSKPDTTVSGFEDNALGHVRVVYQTDQKTFGKIKKIKNDE